MSKKKRISQKVWSFIAAISLLVCIFLGASSITYALVNQDKPDVVVQIDKSGNISQSGDMYEGTLWYPGYIKSGIVRVENNFKRIKVTDLGLDVELAGINKDDFVYDSFINNMLLTLTKGKMLSFDDILIQDKSFSELIADEGTGANGLQFDDTKKFYIEKGDSIDLKYDLLMDLDSGNELEDISANVTFSLNLNETPSQPEDNDNDNGDKDNDKGKNKGSNNLIEEPMEVIPGIDGHWAHDCILALIENDVLDPDSVRRIRPDDYITRAEAAVLMGRALGLEEAEGATGYVDNVPDWARGYVISTTKAKVFKGYPGKIFKSYGNITREEMTAVLIRAFREDSNGNLALSFIDSDMIAQWARGNVAKSVEDGIVTGYPDNSFKPMAYMTRAEAFTIVCRLCGYHELHNKKL